MIACLIDHLVKKVFGNRIYTFRQGIPMAEVTPIRLGALLTLGCFF